MNEFFLNYYNINGILNLFINMHSKVPSIYIKFSAYRKRLSVKGFTMSTDNGFLRKHAGVSCIVLYVLCVSKNAKSDYLSI